MIVSAARLLGNAVVNTQGVPIGHLESIMIELASGRIAHAIVSHGGVLGLGARRCRVDWQDLRLDADGWRFMLERGFDILARNPA